MSYQVLARKYRPQNFNEVISQDHVLKSLIHALDHDRLHHAYLFTGTRGVGKTSLARLLAKSLNCEKGVSSTPCGQCQNCQSIRQGKLVDLIEIDAASRTKVEDTREILENVHYMPTEGRFKVYLIDEVHMLSTHSFNALLKTLEEPPEHVKFILATTDVQKLPVTVLSRCLQYHLKPIDKKLISEHLATILDQEKISYEKGALDQIAYKAKGSLRDSLSLLDQAISFGQGELLTDNVKKMLGLVGDDLVFLLIDCICEKNTKEALKLTETIIEDGLKIDSVFDHLSECFYAISAYQLANLVPFDRFDEEKIKSYAEKISPESLQIFYQIALKSKPELALVVNEKIALDMAIMRMIAFSHSQINNTNNLVQLNSNKSLANTENRRSKKEEVLSNYATKINQPQKPSFEAKKKIDKHIKPSIEVNEDQLEQPVIKNADIKDEILSYERNHNQDQNHFSPFNNWNDLALNLSLRGMAKQLVLNSQFIEVKENAFYLFSEAYQATDLLIEKIEIALKKALNKIFKVKFINDKNNKINQLGDQKKNALTEKTLTPFETKQKSDNALIEQEFQTFKNDPAVQSIEKAFESEFKKDYIRLIPSVE